MTTLTQEQIDALQTWARMCGRNWKSLLRHAWETGNYGGFERSNYLQQVRNTQGPSWLVRYRLPKPEGWTLQASYRTDRSNMALYRNGRDWRMVGSPYGDHNLFDSGEDRAMAHWQGYKQQG